MEKKIEHNQAVSRCWSNYFGHFTFNSKFFNWFFVAFMTPTQPHIHTHSKSFSYFSKTAWFIIREFTFLLIIPVSSEKRIRTGYVGHQQTAVSIIFNTNKVKTFSLTKKTEKMKKIFNKTTKVFKKILLVMMQSPYCNWQRKRLNFYYLRSRVFSLESDRATRNFACTGEKKVLFLLTWSVFFLLLCLIDERNIIQGVQRMKSRSLNAMSFIRG